MRDRGDKVRLLLREMLELAVRLLESRGEIQQFAALLAQLTIQRLQPLGLGTDFVFHALLV